MSETSSAPSILTLPRELRDQIYSYLTHTIHIKWDGFTKDAPRGTEGEEQLLEPICGQLLNCPIPSVLLIHPRIYQEYHASCGEIFEASFDESLSMKGLPDRRVWKPLDNSTIARLRHVKIKITLHVRTTFQNLDWQNHLHFLSVLTAEASQLHTLQVGIRQQHHGGTPNFFDHQVDAILSSGARRSADDHSTHFLPEVPITLNGLSLVQRGEGYHISSTYAKRNYELPQGTDGTNVLLRHVVRKIGVYTYAGQGANYEKRLWTKEKIVSNWLMREYPKPAIDKLSTERAALWARLPRELIGWVERRGEEDVKNWS